MKTLSQEGVQQTVYDWLAGGVGAAPEAIALLRSLR